MNGRRRFVAFGACTLAAPLAARAQPRQVRRIGILSPGESAAGEPSRRAFRELLMGLGHEEGRNLVIERRYAEGDIARLFALAEELVRLEVELIVAGGNDAVAAARRATRTIPIVMTTVAAPVELGFVASLAHPGGNITGLSWVSLETSNKVIQLLKEAAPSAARIATLFDPAAPGASLYRAENRRAASALGMTIDEIDVAQPDHVAQALGRVAAARPDALYVPTDPVTSARFDEIATFALRHKLLSIGTSRPFAQAGGTMCYGPDGSHYLERTVSFVDRILKGAKPAELPVEQPVKFNLVLNLKTAKALGITIPQSLLLRADEVIQ